MNKKLKLTYTFVYLAQKSNSSVLLIEYFQGIYMSAIFLAPGQAPVWILFNLATATTLTKMHWRVSVPAQIQNERFYFTMQIKNEALMLSVT